jgi:hypothetical protein
VLIRTAIAILGAISTISFSSIPAFGDDGTSNVQCGQLKAPSCTLSASTPSQLQNTPSSESPGVQQVNSTTAGSNTCQAPDDRGVLVPCFDPTFGWLGSTGCYYKIDPSFNPPPQDVADQHPAGQAGAYYDATCSPQNLSTGGGVVWLPSGAAGAIAVLPAPAVLAQQATRQLAIPSLSVGASPSVNTDQLVGLPTWLWLEGSWNSVTATAAVPGESVTATATPTSVKWSLGDGNTIECQGPGTPYAATDEPNAPSPTCGYTYQKSSVGQPNDAFSITATVSWVVDWVGGGQSGAVPDLDSTTQASLRVAYVQSLNTENGES